jgi:hypothetical protein
MSVEVGIDALPGAEITVTQMPEYELTVGVTDSIQISVDAAVTPEITVEMGAAPEISIEAPTIFELNIGAPDIIEISVGGGIGSGGGGGSIEEVTIGGPPPMNPPVELWVDLDAVAPPDGGGTAGPLSYVHTQSMLSQDWVVVHDLAWYPNVQAFDAAGYKIHGTVTHDSSMQLTVHFAVAITGKAYCS